MNKRIQTIASLINDAKTILDIGCDHGYLILEALKNNPLLKCHAIEVSIGPLLNAKKTLEKYDNVSFHLSNGLLSFNEEFDLAVISGMGGELTRKILEDSKDKFKGKTLILGPQSDNVVVRKWLFENNFKIVKEINLVENNKYYEIIKAIYEKDNTNYLELLFGKYLYYEANDIYLKHYNKMLENKLKGLKDNNLDVLETVISYRYATKVYKNNYYKYNENVYIDELFLGNNNLIVLVTDNINYTENIAFKLNARGFDTLVINYLKEIDLSNLDDILKKYNYNSYKIISFNISNENIIYFDDLDKFNAYFK